MLVDGTTNFSPPGPDNPTEIKQDIPSQNVITSLNQIQSAISSCKSQKFQEKNKKPPDKILIPSYLQQDTCSSVWFIQQSLNNDYENSLLIRSNNGLQILSSLLQYTDNSTIIDHTIQSLNILSQSFSSDLSHYLDYSRIVELIEGDIDLITKKCALSLILNISCRNPTQLIVDEIIKLCNFEESTIKIYIINIISNIFQSFNTKKQSEISICYIINKIFEIPSKIRDKCLLSLSKISENPENAAIIINSHLDFDRLLHIQNQTQENQTHILKLILALLPKSRTLEPLGHPKYNRPEISNEFASQMNKILANFILERPITPHLCLLAFAASLSGNYSQFMPDDLLISNLLFYSFNENLAPYVLAVFCYLFELNLRPNSSVNQSLNLNTNENNFTDQENIEKVETKQISIQKVKNYYEVVSTLSSVKVNPKIQKWYNEGLNLLKTKATKDTFNFEELSLNEIIEIIDKKEVSPIEFIYGKGTDRTLQLVNEIIEQNNLNETVSQPSEKFIQDMTILSQFAKENLEMFPLSCNYGSNSVKEFLNVLQSNGTLQIVLPSQKTIQVNAPLQSPISLVEGLINSEMNEFNNEMVKCQIDENPEIKKILKLSYPLQASQLSLLSRATDPNYPAMKLRNGTKSYTIHDSMLSIFCDNDQKKNSSLICEIDENVDTEKTRSPKFKEIKLFVFTYLFQLLSILSLKFNLDVFCKSFIEKVHYSLSYPFNSIGRLSSNISLIFAFPFLFPTELKILAFNIVTSDPLSALKKISNEFKNYDGDLSLFPRQSSLKIIVSRSRIFEDGVKYLKLFAQNKIPVDVQFENESGRGPGVTQEFFTLLSEEFKKRKVFRYDESQGLFPSPNADPDMFELLGILVAKSLSMDCQTDFQFNPAFFEKLKGNNIKLSDVDENLDKYLNNDLTGIEYIYHGYDDTINDNDHLELKKFLSQLKNKFRNDKKNCDLYDQIMTQLNNDKYQNKDFNHIYDMCLIQKELFERNRYIQKKKWENSQFLNDSIENYQYIPFHSDYYEKLKYRKDCFKDVLMSMKLNQSQQQRLIDLNDSMIDQQVILNGQLQNNYDHCEIKPKNKVFILELDEKHRHIQKQQKNKIVKKHENRKDRLQFRTAQNWQLRQQRKDQQSQLFNQDDYYQLDLYDLFTYSKPEQKLSKIANASSLSHNQFIAQNSNQQGQKHGPDFGRPMSQLQQAEQQFNMQMIQQQAAKKGPDIRRLSQNQQESLQHQQFNVPKQSYVSYTAEQFKFQPGNLTIKQHQQQPTLQQPLEQQQLISQQKQLTGQQVLLQQPLEQQQLINCHEPLDKKVANKWQLLSQQQQITQQQPPQQREVTLQQPLEQQQQLTTQQPQPREQFTQQRQLITQQLYSHGEESESLYHRQEDQRKQNEDLLSHEREDDSPVFVTPENADEYRRYIAERSINGNIDACCLAFQRGFDSVIPFNLTDIFTSDELSDFIGGDVNPLTFDDLIQNIDLIDFDPTDNQLINLLNSIVKMEPKVQQKFLRFVTSKRHLPFGGLKSLQPRLTIAKVDFENTLNQDFAYPTVSTCSNMLKLPSFSSPEIQERQLLIAMECNSNSFQLG